MVIIDDKNQKKEYKSIDDPERDFDNYEKLTDNLTYSTAISRTPSIDQLNIHINNTQKPSKDKFTRPLKIARLNETISKEKALETLRNIFQIKDFRDGQWEVIDALINRKKKLLLVEKTGYGKSLCFQLPAVFFPGLTVVFSPLIALMRDQVKKLNNIGINAATFNSGNTDQEKKKLSIKSRIEHLN